MNSTTIEAIAALVTAVAGLLAAIGVGQHSKKTRVIAKRAEAQAMHAAFKNAVAENNKLPEGK